MKYDKRCKIWASTSKDIGRYAIHEPWLEGRYLYATDGRQIVRVTCVDVDGDTDGMVTSRACHEAAKGLKSRPAEIAANGAIRVGAATFDRPDDAGPTPESPGDLFPTTKPALSVELTGSLLYSLLDAMGSSAADKGNYTTMEFHVDANDASRVASVVLRNASTCADGVIMPVTQS